MIDGFDDEFYDMMDDVPDIDIEKQDYELPKLVKDYVNVAKEYSIENEFPATVTFFMILGQILKDFYTIPVKAQRIDPRVHFAWFQTARTGKTAIWKMLESICDMVFDEINGDDEKFNTFEIVEATDAALIGSFGANGAFDNVTRQRFLNWLDDNNIDIEDFADEDLTQMLTDVPTIPRDFTGPDDVRIQRQIFIQGGLEGSGLAQWDEFESSGIFKKKSNNENVLVYLQKFMNGLESKSNIIRKRLAGGDKEIVCDCQRSMYATTYVPTNFLEILFNSGALQRALVYVREIDEDILHIQRDTFIDGLGEEFDGFPECERFANALVRIYQEVGKRFNEVGVKSKVFTFDPNAKEVLRLSYNKMEYIILNHPPKIRKLARSFQINLIQYEMIFSTLICAIESVNRTQGKFVVTAKNMHQARKVVEPCYDYLIEWLQNSIRGDVVTAELQHTSRVKTFKETYNGFEKKDGWVNQKEYLYEVAAKMSKGTSTIYRYWKKDKVSECFESKQVGRTTYIKWRKQE